VTAIQDENTRAVTGIQRNQDQRRIAISSVSASTQFSHVSSFKAQGKVRPLSRNRPVSEPFVKKLLISPSAANRSSEIPPLYAALDLGTHNCRLLIASPSGRGFRVRGGFSRIVRLGEGLDATGILGESAIIRTIDALAMCREKLSAANVTRARLVATQACRAAKNGELFVQRVARETGLELEIIDRQTEASLSVTGCASLMDPYAGSAMIFDIGGGSTELIWVEGLEGNRHAKALQNEDPCQRIKAWDSLPIGVVTLTERYAQAPVTGEVFESMVAHISTLMTDFAARAAPALERRHFHLLGTSGTVTTLGGLYLGLPHYDRRRIDGLWMQDRDVTRIMDDLLDSADDMERFGPSLCGGRTDLILAGCAILEAIRRTFPSERLRIADRGLREGIVVSLMREDGFWPRNAHSPGTRHETKQAGASRA
jgi:exopolyphosphatase / guanosine-5'-triphosphate,3'-diphosphate pyrophosphatase